MRVGQMLQAVLVLLDDVLVVVLGAVVLGMAWLGRGLVLPWLVRATVPPYGRVFVLCSHIHDVAPSLSYSSFILFLWMHWSFLSLGYWPCQYTCICSTATVVMPLALP
jgi:hypothetical protein